MARQVSTTTTAAWTVAAWAVGLIIFFPILWTVLTSFKSEDEAIASPPQFLYLHSSLSDYLVSYHEVFTRGDGYWPFFLNSVIIALGSTLLALIIAIPSAWAMAFAPGPKTKDLLMWMLSTKMMPAVGALVPIFLVFKDWGMLNNTFASLVGMVVVLALINLPIIVWMLYTYFKEIPNDILEAGRMDGASLTQEILYILTPMAVPGIASTLLLNFILAWNEAFWTLNITSPGAQPLTAFIGGYSSPEGLFYAKLSAASTLAIAPILIIGWFSQKQLVRGLTFGAVK